MLCLDVGSNPTNSTTVKQKNRLRPVFLLYGERPQGVLLQANHLIINNFFNNISLALFDFSFCCGLKRTTRGSSASDHSIISPLLLNFQLSNPLNMCMPLPYCVYILFSERDKQLYTGYTSNIQQRIINHNNGGTTSTRNRTPLKLIFCEYYLFKEDALKREKYFKTTMGKKAVKLMLANSLLKMGYKNMDVQIIADDDI